MTTESSRPRGPLRRAPLRWGVASLVAVGLVVVVGQAVVAEVVVVPSGAMRPALEPGDRVLVEKTSLPGRAPERGELVVFHRSGSSEPQGIGGALRSLGAGLGLVAADEDLILLQRVLGLPGEIVEVRAGVVHIDGEPLSEPYATLGHGDVAPTHLPPGHYWLLGDDRPLSADTRPPGKPVSRDQLVGRALMVLWPPTRMSQPLHAEPDPATRADRQLPW